MFRILTPLPLHRSGMISARPNTFFPLFSAISRSRSIGYRSRCNYPGRCTQGLWLFSGPSQASAGGRSGTGQGRLSGVRGWAGAVKMAGSFNRSLGTEEENEDRKDLYDYYTFEIRVEEGSGREIVSSSNGPLSLFFRVSWRQDICHGQHSDNLTSVFASLGKEEIYGLAIGDSPCLG